uniref:Uncharacterized protein n=1 Tax=Oryza brachyantha TaxID=4533 RepID=J3LSR6_ORYBR
MDLAYFEPMGPDPYIWSPFYVQLTEFTDKSYALGLSCTHLHNDPTAAVLFVAGEGLVVVLPSAEGEAARDVVVTLPAEATARICHDGEVLRYGADVVFGPKPETQAS